MFGQFGNVSSTQGAGSIGSNPMRDFEQGMDMAGMGLRSQAFAKAKQYKRESDLAMAEARVAGADQGGQSPMGAIQQGLGLAENLLGGLGGGAAGAAGGAFGIGSAAAGGLSSSMGAFPGGMSSAGAMSLGASLGGF